jgi:hypothetical protein
MLADQNNMIEEQSLDPTINKEDQNRRQIQQIKENLIGYHGNLDNKDFLFDGGLLELDPVDYRPIRKVHLFLFADVLLLAKVLHDRKLEYVSITPLNCPYSPHMYPLFR